mgnify:CR=1 FL=1
MLKLNKIYNKDCLEGLKQIPNNFVDPPYKMEAHGRGMASKRELYKEMESYTNLNNDWYCEEILDEYVRVCKFPNIFLFCGKNDLVKILNYAEKHNYFYFILPICKKTPMPFVNNTWMSNEYAVHIIDRKLDYTMQYNLKIPYFIVDNKKETNHPNEKNLDMIKKIIANITFEGACVLDCFVGSGSIPVGCLSLGRAFIGFEIDNKYFKMANDRLKQLNDEPELF